MNQSASNSIDKQLVLYLQFDRVFQRLAAAVEHVIETLGLSDCSRETIQDKSMPFSVILNSGVYHIPVPTIFVCIQLILDHVNHNVIADKTTLVHDLLCFST